MRLRLLALVSCAATAWPQPEAASREFFENRIRPVLARNCLGCHAGERPQGGLRLDFRGGWESGGKSGAAIVKGDPSRSLLLRVIRHDAGVSAMPLGGKKLDDAAISAFEQWIRAGAADPRDKPAGAAVSKSWEETFRERSQWWSLRPVSKPAVPSGTSASPVDRFLSAKIREKRLTPALPADRATLLRRLSFVLSGLPPASTEIDAFASDPSREAYSKQVDRLLGSVHFGEHWARHWMDAVRYSDTYGYEWDIPAKGSWRYRDYLIRAFNGDVAYDQLVREQIAGDLLPRPRVNAKERINESAIGPMFFQMGEKRHGDSLQFNGIHQEMLNNKIDAFSKAFFAMTVACARCHDHRLDAISQRDYYALGGVFMSSRWVTNTVDLPGRNQTVIAELRAMKPRIRESVSGEWRRAVAEIPRYMLAAQACLRGDPGEEKLAEGLDPARLEAWKKALGVDHGTTPPFESPVRPWSEAARSRASWREIANSYASEMDKRRKANAEGFTTIADFRSGSAPADWPRDGAGLRDGFTRSGEFAVGTSGDRAIAMIFPAGLFTNTVSPRLNGAIRSPFTNLLGKANLSLELAGGDLAAQRLVVDNAFLTERQKSLDTLSPSWTRVAARAREKGDRAQTPLEEAEMRVYVEVATKASNPNFPPRVGLAGKDSEKRIHEPQSWFGITRVVAHDGEQPPADELARFESLLRGDAASLDAVAAEYARWFGEAVDAFARDAASDDHARVLNWMIERRLLPNEPDALVARYREVEKRIAEPWTVNGMADIDPGRDYRLNQRGVHEDLGAAVPRGFVEVLSKSGAGAVAEAGSGRLHLASLAASPDNPLTARVWVNRVWHWIFGTGIVATTDDFGHLGELPSHPELLDYLAAEFVANGWSTKRLIRELVMSEAFQRSSVASAEEREADPLGRLLSHYPVRRLEAESIRDSMLAVSGRLDRAPYGEPVNPPRSNEDPAKRLFSGPLDGNGRRSIYTKMTIMEPPKFLAAFNQPAPKIPAGRRDQTNVPAQALALLNDPFALAQAEFWARQLVAEAHSTPEQRIEEMFRRAFGRVPTGVEIERWTKAARDFSGLYHDAPGALRTDMMKSLAVWKDMAHAIFNSKEFLYVR